MEHFVKRITKEKTLITCELEDGGIVTYDMATKVMYSFTNRTVKRFPSNISCSFDRKFSKIEDLLFVALRGASDTQCTSLEKLEKFMGVPDLLENVCEPQLLPSDCPKGFIQWVRENERRLNENTLNEYLLLKTKDTLPKESRAIVDILTGDRAPYENSLDFVKTYCKMTEKQRNSFNQIFKASLKEICWNLASDVRNFVRFAVEGEPVEEYVYIPDYWENFVDTNRDFKYNLKVLLTMTENRGNKILIEREDIIRFITEMSGDKYTIVVPETVQDFVDEGRMQNNCVSYFYHDSIKKGKNFVYFIRKTEKPKHSYITCRFNVSMEKTVEAKIVNNDSVKDLHARKLIKEIDKKIREKLGLEETALNTSYRNVSF